MICRLSSWSSMIKMRLLMACLPVFAVRTGMLKKNVEPSPRTDSTHNLPPCISTIRFAIANPSPVPPLERVEELSTCWNSSKIRCCSDSAIPGPVSATETRNSPLALTAPTLSSPFSVNLMALPTRFSRTCAMRRSSPSATGRSGCTSTESLRPFAAASDSIEVMTVWTMSGME